MAYRYTLRDCNSISDFDTESDNCLSPSYPCCSTSHDYAPAHPYPEAQPHSTTHSDTAPNSRDPNPELYAKRNIPEVSYWRGV